MTNIKNTNNFKILKGHFFECIKLHNISQDNNNIILNWEDYTDKFIKYLEKEAEIKKDVCLKEFEKYLKKIRFIMILNIIRIKQKEFILNRKKIK